MNQNIAIYISVSDIWYILCIYVFCIFNLVLFFFTNNYIYKEILLK